MSPTDYSQQTKKIAAIKKKFQLELSRLKKEQDMLIARYIEIVTEHKVKMLKSKIESLDE
jgi:hypothetical protein